MEEMVEDFLQALRNERGRSEQTQKTYAAALKRFVEWANGAGLHKWSEVELPHLTKFLLHEQERPLEGQAREKKTKLSTSSIYLQIAALRAFYKFCEMERYLPTNVAENLSLPRRWKRLPKTLSDEEIRRLLQPLKPETPES